MVFSEVTANAVPFLLRDAAARAVTESAPQHPPQRVRWFVPESEDERRYVEQWGARDWEHFRASRDVVARLVDGELWVRVDGATEPRIAAAVKSKFKPEIN